MGWRLLTTRRFSVGFLKLLILLSLVESPHRSWAAPDRGFSSNNLFNQNDHIYRGIDIDDDDFAQMTTKIIAGILIFVVLASFIAFLICLCCPICLLAKMRQRRRGFVYQTAANGTAGANPEAGSTAAAVTQSPPPPVSQPSGGGAARNAPYPVQQSVTVMGPGPQVQNPPYGPSSMGYPGPVGVPMPPYPSAPGAMPMPTSNMPDLPPPYPGLPRETESIQQGAQPPYNPYFSGSEDNSASRAPYMPTTAPYPTKN